MEGYRFDYEYAGEDVVVLAGDIHCQDRHPDLLDQICKFQNIQIILVAGNHEYYGSEFSEVNEYLSNLQNRYPNVHYLENNSIKIDGVNFYGGPMFTDFMLYGEGESFVCKLEARHGIADFRYIETNGVRWGTGDHIAQHELYVKGLEQFLAEEHEKRVVISHFMPTEKLTHPRFSGSPLNPFFTSNMERYMGWPGLWLCGHGHDSADIMVGDTRVVMNPRGYGDENVWGFNPNLILEI